MLSLLQLIRLPLLRTSNLNAIRLLSTNVQHQNVSSAVDDQTVVRTLQRLGFSATQINSLLNNVFKSNFCGEARNPEHIEQVFQKWFGNMKRTEVKSEWDEKDYSAKVTIHQVLANIEPKLMLATPKFIDTRIKDLLDLEVVNNRTDLWRAFVFAPAAFYLQDWGEFMQKYIYLNLRVYEWLYNKHERKNLYPHPLLRFARVFEPSMEHIRARFLFAQRTGLNAISSFSKVPLVKLSKKKVDLGVLILADLDAYLRLVAPSCKPEEYAAFKDMLEYFEDEDEDMNLHAQIAELNLKPDAERSHAYNTDIFTVSKTNEVIRPSYEVDMGKFKL